MPWSSYRMARLRGALSSLHLVDCIYYRCGSHICYCDMAWPTSCIDGATLRSKNPGMQSIYTSCNKRFWLINKLIQLSRITIDQLLPIQIEIDSILYSFLTHIYLLTLKWENSSAVFMRNVRILCEVLIWTCTNSYLISYSLRIQVYYVHIYTFTLKCANIRSCFHLKVWHHFRFIHLMKNLKSINRWEFIYTGPSRILFN